MMMTERDTDCNVAAAATVGARVYRLVVVLPRAIGRVYRNR